MSKTFSLIEGEMTMKTILFVPSGPMVRVGKGVIEIRDLNPEAHLIWRLTRGEMLRMAIGFFRAAITP